MSKILLTGFEPFQNESLNPSRELALFFQSECDTLVLPVSYRRATEVLRPHLEVGRYDFILMLGQAGGRKSIDLERVALNLEDSETADEDGDLRLQTAISSEGPAAYINPLPLRDLSRYLQTRGFPAQVSFSAGAFVCNSVYYQVFDWIKKSGRRAEVLFVHLPYLPEQVAGKPEGTAFLPLETMKSAIGEVIKSVKS